MEELELLVFYCDGAEPGSCNVTRVEKIISASR